jgi:electron transfer flavoprotein alpha subunit
VLSASFPCSAPGNWPKAIGRADVIAVVVVRDGALPLGADECVAEAGGRVLLVGTGTSTAAKELVARVTDVRAAEVDGGFAPGAWARAIAPLLREEDVVVLPASADGRDLAPRLAFALDRPLLAGAVLDTRERVVVARDGGLVAEEHDMTQPFVATLEPGVRGVEPAPADATPPPPTTLELTIAPGTDVHVVDVLPPDPTTMDLSEAPRIVSGGAGLRSAEAFVTLQQVATALGASYGASRVVADAGWVPQDRFIGTTGVAVDPKLYVAFGISGAVQHVSGLGDPDHIISVNVDRSCPMMSMADLAIVADAPATLDALARKLEVHDSDG